MYVIVVQQEKTIICKRFRSAVAALAAKVRLVAKFPGAMVEIAEAAPTAKPPRSRSSE